MLASDFVTRTKAAIAQMTEPDVSFNTVDISNCDREAIHTPGAIQPHGVLLACDSNWTITHVSQNTQQLLGRDPQKLLGRALQGLLGDASVASIDACLEGAFDAVNPLQFDLKVHGSTQTFSGVVHRSQESVLLELEPASSSETVSFFDFHSFVKKPISRFQRTQTRSELCQAAVEELKHITGFDRVMAYQLDEDGAGQVIAEVTEPGMTPFLGLHYPPTDIPKQAKYLYLLNLLRLIPDVAYEPVPLVTRPAPPSGQPLEQPLDMSLSMLRSVSPLHTEYLQNMGVKATLAISLVHDNQLWGLLVCHHNSPRQLSYERRTICEFLGQAVGLELAAKANSEDIDYRLKLKALQVSFVKTLSQSPTLKEGLTQHPDRLLALTGASGVAFCEKGELTLLGETPTLPETQSLVHWLGTQFNQAAVYESSALGQVYSPAHEFESRISGLLAIAISQAQQLYVVWFRSEVLQTVNWAGNPDKPVEIDANGVAKLSPRQSFDRWKQTVSGRSLPWKACEQEAAFELRTAVIGLVLQQADELAELNFELERSNIELDSFAYIASHDLKEPLRGIHNYASFLIEDYGETLGADGKDKLNTLMRLTQRMEDLISSLLHYSRLGRADLQRSPVDLNSVVEGAVELIKVSKPEAVRFDLQPGLPVVACDRTQITELFTNLITNAIKYNDKDDKHVEVGYLSGVAAAKQGLLPPVIANIDSPGDEPATPVHDVFYVRDNGIGIREKHLESVFRIFKRLHAPTRFGGGTGAGLTIAKKIVERHGGRLWIDSTYGEGSSFYFTLGQHG